MIEEPFGHRGHPTNREYRRASKLALRLERAITRLQVAGFTEREAVAFIAGIASEKAANELGENWGDGPIGAKETIDNLRAGHAAKEWSISAIILALYEVADLTRE